MVKYWIIARDVGADADKPVLYIMCSLALSVDDAWRRAEQGCRETEKFLRDNGYQAWAVRLDPYEEASQPSCKVCDDMGWITKADGTHQECPAWCAARMAG
jgi:hypothetical protein